MDNIWIQAYIYSGMALILGLIYYIIKSSMKRKAENKAKEKDSFFKTLEDEMKSKEKK